MKPMPSEPRPFQSCPYICLVGLVIKNIPANMVDIKDTTSVSDSGRAPGGGHGNPLQDPFLEGHMDRGAWPAGGSQKRLQQLSTQHGSRLSDNLLMYMLEKLHEKLVVEMLNEETFANQNGVSQI